MHPGPAKPQVRKLPQLIIVCYNRLSKLAAAHQAAACQAIVALAACTRRPHLRHVCVGVQAGQRVSALHQRAHEGGLVKPVGALCGAEAIINIRTAGFVSTPVC